MRLLGESTARMAPELLMLTAYKAKRHPAAAVPALLALDPSVLGTWGPPMHSLVEAPCNEVGHGGTVPAGGGRQHSEAQPVMRWPLSLLPHTQPALHLLASITPWRTTCRQCQKRSASARQGVQPCAVPRVLLTVPVAARVCPSASCSSLTSPGAHKVCSADLSLSTSIAGNTRQPLIYCHTCTVSPAQSALSLLM